MRRAARGMRRLGISFDALLTSGLVRARQTAEIVADALGLEAQLQEISELAPENSVDHLISALTRFQDKNIYSSSATIPLLGHAFSFLVSGQKDHRLKSSLKKADSAASKSTVYRPAPRAPCTGS